MDEFIERDYEWILDDINDSLRIRVYYLDKDGNSVSGSCLADEIKKLDMDNLSVEDGNINDINNLIMGMVRFRGEDNDKLFFDIPLRNMYKLYEKKNEQGSSYYGMREVEGFSPSDIMEIETFMLSERTDELEEMLDLSKNFFGNSMSEEFKIISRVNELNNLRKEKIISHKR